MSDPKKLRTVIESIIIEALEEWMDECDSTDMGNKDNAKNFGGGEIEKKNEASKKKKMPPAFLRNSKKKTKKS